MGAPNRKPQGRESPRGRVERTPPVRVASLVLVSLAGIGTPRDLQA
jgi:hypothetical protein